MRFTRQRFPFRARLCAISLLALGTTFSVDSAHAAPNVDTDTLYAEDGTLLPPKLPVLSPTDPTFALTPLDPRRYKILPPPYVPRSVTADPWAIPSNGFPLANLLYTATEACAVEESTDSISRSGRGHIPKNLRCARTVGYLLHHYVPQFQGHDWAETCARRIVNKLKAKRTRTYNLQDQLDNVPEGYLYVICLLSSPKSRVGHICFYDPETRGVLGNCMGVWKSQPLEHFWGKYRYYYLLGVPVRSPQITANSPAPDTESAE